MDFLTDSLPLHSANGGRLDLGFGFDIDVEHDWSEGAGFDLFDGFFFGGGGAGGGLGNGAGTGTEAGVGG